ncbi:MAG: hypothetical protein WCK67_01405 [bacterium]
MVLAHRSGFTASNFGMQIGFGYYSVMKKIATKEHVHCAYGGEELNEDNPATAEHVEPHSKGGADDDSNFLPVCEKHNGERGCRSYKRFLREKPKVWNNIKRTILEINKIKTENFDGHEWAKKIIKAVEIQSKQKLNIDIDNEENNILNKEEDHSETEYDLDKTLITTSGKKIYIKREKPLDLFA